MVASLHQGTVFQSNPDDDPPRCLSVQCHLAMTTHPAKSGNDWTADDLAFYGVKIEYQDVQQFFGEVPLPAPSICQGFLTADTNNDVTDRESAVLMYYLKLATDAPDGYKETILPFFVMVLFDSLGYNRGFCGRCSWAALPFLNSGQVRDVRIDAALMKSQRNCRISLVVHQDMLEAAFQFTNDTRRMEGLAELNGQVIPGIIMTGTLPTFFKIPITQELARSVESGQPTATPTIINGHVPGVLHPKDGMMPLDNRCVLLQCFEAFKRYIEGPQIFEPESLLPVMANIPRSAKSGDEWNQNDLHSYDIKIEFQDAQTFFSETSLPEPSVQQDFLTARSCDHTIDDVSFNLFAQLECAIPYGQGWDNGTVDFVVALFHAMGYMHRPHVIHSGMKLPFDICSKEEIIHTDVCISRTDTKQIILLVQVAEPDMDPHARLIAAAIAAFQDNNDTGPPMWSPLDNRVIFGIILYASCPSFFKIPVTRVLSECVQYGQFPPTPTIVAGFVPDIHSNSDRFLLGMGDLDQRRIFLQCFEAFKKFLM